MRETIDLRISEDDAQEHLEPSVGVTLGGSVRKVVVATDDPLFQRICEIDRDFQQRTNGCHFYPGWILHRHYTKSELDAAESLSVKIKRTFEPAGEECGTVYDETTACELCGSGASQSSDLVLDPRSLAKSRSLAIAKTIAGEIVVSEKFIELIETHGFTGAMFRPVRYRGKQPAMLPRWEQLYATWYLVNIVPPTRTGVNPSDDDAKGEFRCPRGHTIGLNLLSELSVSREDFLGCRSDIAFTRQRVGLRSGLLRPEASLLISPRLWRALEESGLKGFGVEVAHLK